MVQYRLETDARPEAIFELLKADRRKERLDDAISQVPSSGEFGVGFRVRRTNPHGDHRCTTVYEVIGFRPPELLEEEWVHTCLAAERVLRGVLRVEIEEGADRRHLVVTARDKGLGLLGLLTARCRLGATAMKVAEGLAFRAQQATPSSE